MHIELGQLDLKYGRLRGFDHRRQRRLIASLAECRQHVPVLVVASGQPHRWTLIDGYARTSALRKLGRDKVWAMAPEVTEVEALILRQCSSGRHSSALEDGWLVRELVEGHGYELGEVARDLGRSRSWASRRLGLVKTLPPVVQKAVREGRVCAFAATKYLLPLARANAQQCKVLMTALGKSRLTSRQLESLYQAWRKADAVGRARIVEEPLAVLRLEHDRCRPEPPAVALSKQLQVLCNAARRAQEHVQDITEQSWATSVQARWQRAQCAVGSLTRAIQETSYAGSKHADSHSETP